MRAFISKYWALSLVIVAAAAFFVFASSFNFLSQRDNFVKWLSPDETANYTAAKLYAESGQLAFFEKYNLISKDIIHPRSFRSDWGWIKPVSFLGLPIIYGQIAALLGSSMLPYLTPLFAAVGLIFFYLLIRRIFGKTNAVISTILAAAFPVLIYYSARSMFHNVLFVTLVIISLYCALRLIERRDQGSYLYKNTFGFLFAFAAGLFFGAAATVRGSELLWLAPLFIFLYIFNIKRVGFVRALLFLYGVFTAFLPTLYWNQTLYGSLFSSGYPELNNSLASLSESSGQAAGRLLAFNFAELKATLGHIKATIFHFGFKPEQSFRLFNAYVRTMFPWLFWSSLAGLVMFFAFFKEYTKRRWLFLIGWLGLSWMLVMYYGSWLFYDNPDPNSFTIGNSYTRYWLPLYLGALPFASLALIKITALARQRYIIGLLRTAAVAVVVALSIQYVWAEPSEGLKVSIDKQAAARLEAERVWSLTEERSVIITRYHDKLLFPERKVVIGLFNDPNMIAEYAHLAKRLPVYYYNFSFKPEDLEYLNAGMLIKEGINLSLVQPITDKFSLYVLRKNE